MVVADETGDIVCGVTRSGQPGGSVHAVAARFCGMSRVGHILPLRFVMDTDAAAAANVTRDVAVSKVATLNDTCGNLIQLTQLMRWVVRRFSLRARLQRRSH
jgi:hypothetical protein